MPTTERATTERATIIARATPCKCGCHGADPWHRKTFTRTVREIHAVNRESYRGPYLTEQITRIGVASLPWDPSVAVVEVEVWWSLPSGRGHVHREWRIA